MMFLSILSLIVSIGNVILGLDFQSNLYLIVGCIGLFVSGLSFRYEILERKSEKNIKIQYPIIAMIGSSRFREQYQREAKRLTLEGNLVIPLILYRDTDAEDAFNPKNATILKNICNQKIELCDVVFVVNYKGYIGTRTKETIQYAKSLGKEIVYME